MNKAYLETCLSMAANNYIWSLYFFNSHKPRNSSRVYESQKIRFTNNAHLVSYAEQVLSAIEAYQLSPVSQVEKYNGYNTKCSCDRLNIEDEIIQANFTSFRDSLAHAVEGNLKASYRGYVLEGQPHPNVTGQTITLVKFANPTTRLKGKKSTYFKKGEDDLLDEITEQFFKMYLTVDCILIENNLYVFNHAFEKIFDIEQTFSKVKSEAIKSIVDAGFISNPDIFVEHAQSTHSRTFATLDDERMQRAMTPDGRNKISEDYKVPLCTNGLFEISTAEETKHLLMHLCYKAFKEAETNTILEASNVAKLTIEVPA